MAELSQAYVAHQLAGRIRVRIPGRRYDLPFFEQLNQRLRDLPDVETVEVNPSTGSILIRAADAALVTQRAVEEKLFTLIEPPNRPHDEERLGAAQTSSLIERGRRTLRTVDRGVARITGGRESLQSLVLAGLLGGGLVQLARGRVLAPAATLFWYAGGLLRLWYDDPLARATEASDSERTGVSA